MRQAPKPILSTRRLARLNAWARLWFVWFAGAVATWWSGGGRAHPRALDRVARLVARIIVINVAAHVPPIAPSRNRHGRLQAVTLRRLCGGRLRRAMRGRDYPSRLMAILTVMRDAARHIVRELRRLRRGLSRLRILYPEAGDAPLIVSAPPAAVSPDTS